MCNGTSSGSDPCQEAPKIRLEGRPFIVGVWVSYGHGGSGMPEPTQTADGVEVADDGSVERFGWWAGCTWHTTAINHPSNMQGTISTCYANENLADAIDYVLATAQKFGVLLGAPATDRVLWLEYNDADLPQAPARWREVLKFEAARRGWHVELREDLINA